MPRVLTACSCGGGGTCSSATGAECVLNSWDGASVDQINREYLLCANGGHADGADNSCYGIKLGSAAPQWKRLTDPTPNSHIVFCTSGPTPGDTYLDGRPKAMHNTLQVFGDGQVWMPFQNSTFNPAGNGANWAVSFNRRDAALIAAEALDTPLAWTAANTGPWSTYDDPFRFSPAASGHLQWMGFGSAVFDPVQHNVWAVAGKYAVIMSVATQGANRGKAGYVGNVATQGGGNGTFGGWSAMADDLRLVVIADTTYNNIVVFKPDLAGQAGDTQVIANPSGTGFYGSGSGGVYVKANHSILVGNPKATGGIVYKLQIPTQGGAYNPNGTWTWTTITPTGQAPNTFDNAAANNDAFSKWNLIQDMGNGEGALLFVPALNGPVYVLKIPAAGL